MTALIPARSSEYADEQLRAAQVLAKLLTDPALASVWMWKVNSDYSSPVLKQSFCCGHLVGQLGVTGPDLDERDNAVVAWLSAVASTHGGAFEVEEPGTAHRMARCRFTVDGIVVTLWDIVQTDARFYVWDPVATEASDDHDDDQAHEDAAAKVTPGADEGATGGAITPPEITAAFADLDAANRTTATRLDRVRDALTGSAETIAALSTPDRGLPVDVMHAYANDDPPVQAHYRYGEDDHEDAEPAGLGDLGTETGVCDDCGTRPDACGHCVYCDACQTCGRCAGRGCTCACPRAGGAE